VRGIFLLQPTTCVVYNNISSIRLPASQNASVLHVTLSKLLIFLLLLLLSDTIK
jgi:hypothetical protein